MLANDALIASATFVRDVDAYSTRLVLKRVSGAIAVPSPRVRRLRTVAEAGFRVRVGPALGFTPAYVLEPDESEVEPELLALFVDGREIEEGRIRSKGRRVIALHGQDGKLLPLSRYARAYARLRRFRPVLEQRSIVRTSGLPWYAPIDRVRPQDWQAIKLLVPELSKVPRVAIDKSGAIPSHGVYAVFGPSAAAQDDLYAHWRDGGLARALEGFAPKVKGGYVRCYKRFLDALPAPK